MICSDPVMFCQNNDEPSLTLTSVMKQQQQQQHNCQQQQQPRQHQQSQNNNKYNNNNNNNNNNAEELKHSGHLEVTNSSFLVVNFCLLY
jgi:hypothetical protein